MTQTRRVSDHQQSTWDFDADAMRALLEQGARELDTGGDRICQIDGPLVEPDVPARDTRHIEQVVDQPHHVLHLPIDDRSFALKF